MRFYELFIAFKYLKANLRQSIIITIAITIGVALIIWIPSINLSFFGDLIDKSVSSAPNITITKELDTFKRNKSSFDLFFADRTLLLKDQVQTRKRNIKSYKQIMNQVKHVEQIEAMAPFVSEQGFIIKAAEERGAQVRGIIPELETKVVDIEKDIIRGGIKNLGINDIVIGVTLAEKLNAEVGDRVTVTGPRGISRNLKVIGIISTGLRSKDEFQVYVSLKSGQQVFDLGNDVNGIGIKIKDIYEANKVAAELREITGLNVDSWMEDNKQILDQINRFKLIIVFINFLIIFSAASSITSVFIMLIASKAKEIGILKSMGAKNHSVMAIFIIQALFLSLLAYVLGIICAKLLLMWYASLIAQAGETFLTSEVPVFRISPQYAVLAFFYSTVTSILASVIPSYQAAKLNPVEAINA
ncbi:MAG TPA: ABC transporter permease [Candidatus Gastranaerophilales bacterium]|nr:ABC transporter permease [Candidatus Gastranaerophilales bacterium]